MRWNPTDQQVKKAHANEIDTTEAGAYASVLAAVELVKGMVAVYRAETKTGADYYISPSGQLPQDLESCIRLEISGVDRGSNSTITSRLKAKLKQTEDNEVKAHPEVCLTFVYPKKRSSLLNGGRVHQQGFRPSKGALEQQATGLVARWSR